VTPLLSICIPTYNRLPYLRELVGFLLPQISATISGEVEIVISNNVSTDGTDAYCKSLVCPALRYWENETNIGGDRNFLKCIREAHGEYVWLIGDDDLINPDAVTTVLNLLKAHRPSLLIADEHPRKNLTVYTNYRECLLRERTTKGLFALNHTLISANIFKRACFDLAYAEEMLYTQYAHMFGLVRNLTNTPVVIAPALMTTRPVRADFAKYPSFLCIKHAIYLRYLAKTFSLPNFNGLAVKSVCNLPLELGSRIKYYLLKFLHALKNARIVSII